MIVNHLVLFEILIYLTSRCSDSHIYKLHNDTVLVPKLNFENLVPVTFILKYMHVFRNGYNSNVYRPSAIKRVFVTNICSSVISLKLNLPSYA